LHDSSFASALRSGAAVFRKYLDYGVFDALRGLHRQIRTHDAPPTIRPRANDVSSRGGIREIEFTTGCCVGATWLHWTLARLARAQLMPQATADALGETYVFCAGSGTGLQPRRP
jgi:glutamate-ammonia-ligase adenylyltransferase